MSPAVYLMKLTYTHSGAGTLPPGVMLQTWLKAL